MHDDVFRREPRQLSKWEEDRITAIKAVAGDLYTLIDGIVEFTQKGGREAALAKTKLEECVMWATKGASAVK